MTSLEIILIAQAGARLAEALERLLRALWRLQ